MGVQSSISLADAAATPVTHVFAPMGVRPPDPRNPQKRTTRWWRAADYSKYVDGTIPSALPPVGFPTIDLAFSTPSGQNRNYRIGYWFTLPALEVISGVSSSGYQAADRPAALMSFKAEIVINERAASALRYDFHKMAVKPLDYTLGSGAPLYDAIHDLVPVW